MMGSGKSTVGRLLAERLGWPVVDTDERIVAAAGRPIADIFAREGEAAFRDLESRAVREAAAMEQVVLALGGGAILRPESREAVWASSLVVWLSADPEEHLARVARSEQRPLLQTGTDPLETARRILKEREPLYALAHWKEDTTGRSPEDIAESIERRWNSL